VKATPARRSQHPVAHHAGCRTGFESTHGQLSDLHHPHQAIRN
jgi:hypothetical protein